MDELDKRRRRRLLEIAPTFNSDVPALDLLDQLPCIASKSTREKIKNTAKYGSTVDANRELSSSLTGRTGWYDQLLEGLEAIDCKGIADMMRKDSRGSLCSSKSSAPQSYPSAVVTPHYSQRHDAHETWPSLPGDRSVSMSTTVNHWPIGVRRAVQVLDLPNEGGLCNNWEKLADLLLDVRWEECKWLERCDRPSAIIVEAWYEKRPKNATLGNFLQVLEKMDRFDVISEIKEVIGWEHERAVHETHSRTLLPDLQKSPQYNNNLFDCNSPSSNMDDSRTTRSLPLDLKDQQKKLAMFSNKQASQDGNFRYGQQFNKKMNNQPQNPLGTSTLLPSSQDKSMKRQINDHNFPGKELAGSTKEIREAPSQNESSECTQLADGFAESQTSKSGLTEMTKKELQKKGNEMQHPATDKSISLDCSKGATGGNQTGRTLFPNQRGHLFGGEPGDELARRKPVSSLQSSKKGNAGEMLDLPQQIPIPQEKPEVNVGKIKENLDHQPKKVDPVSIPKVANGGGAHHKVSHVGAVQNNLQMNYPECQPNERTLNPNIMTTDSRKGTESNNIPLFQEKHPYKKQILKELGVPSNIAMMPSQKFCEPDQVEHDMSDSPAHSLVSTETIRVSSCDILESMEDPSNIPGESTKSTKEAADTYDKEKLQENGKEGKLPERSVVGKNPEDAGIVVKPPSQNESQIMPQEPLHPDTKNTDGNGRMIARNQVLPSRSYRNLNGEETCKEWDREKLGKDCRVDPFQKKMDQGKDDWGGMVAMEDDHQNISGDSKKIGNSEDSKSNVHSPSIGREKNVLITRDFTHVLDQNTGAALGSVPKKPLISKDFTMMEQNSEENRERLEDNFIMQYEDGIKQSDQLKVDKQGNDGAHTLQSMSCSQEVGKFSTSPMPLKSQDCEGRERSAQNNLWGHSLVKGMASSVLRNLFGNNLSSL